MSRYTVVLCEGAHDVAFILRVLKLNGYEEERNNIKNITGLEYTLADYFEYHQKERGKRLGFVPNNKVPKYVLKKDEEFVFLHDMGGDRRIQEREDVRVEYLRLKTTEKEDDDYSEELSQNIEYRFLYFFDADDKEYTLREKEIQEELKIDSIGHRKIVKGKEAEYGCYIFFDKETKKGTLETLLLKVLKEKETEKYEKIKKFLDENCLEQSRRRNYDDSNDCHKGNEKYNKYKSKINLFGQLQLSGVNNQVIIERSDYFKKENLAQLKECEEIVELFI